jgi:hypothetical protein
MPGDVLQTVESVHGHTIRVTARQWGHITEAHDYMAGNLDKVLETLAEPSQVIEGKRGEYLALREYVRTSISRKTVVVIYRDEPEGFVITAFFTSKPEKVLRKGSLVWPILRSPEN